MADDAITLGGQTFPIRGNPTASVVSDFEVGLKVGKTSYDNREHAFFLVLEDFTGGFGSKYMDIREELGTYWFADPEKAPETSYSGAVTLPLAQSYVSIPDGPGSFDGNVNVGHMALERNSWYVFGLGGGIYTLDALGATPVLRDSSAYPVVSIINAVDSVEGDARLYVARRTPGTAVVSGADPYGNPKMSLDDGATWAAIMSRTGAFDLFPPIAGKEGEILAQDTVFQYQTGVQVLEQRLSTRDSSGTLVGTIEQLIVVPEYEVTVYENLNPFQGRPMSAVAISDIIAAAARENSVPVQDLFFWDHKVLGQFAGNKIVFLVPANGDGLVYYRVPPGEYIQTVARQNIGSVQSGSTVREYTVSSYDTSGTPIESVEEAVVEPDFTQFQGWVVTSTINVTDAEGLEYSLSVGEEPWNNLIEGDEQIVAAADLARELRFVGVAPAPWGEPAVYMRGGNRLYILDFFARKMHPIEVGANKPLIDGCVWQGSLMLTDGWNVFEYNPTSNNQRNLSLPNKWGIPPNLIGDDVYQIIKLIPHDDELLAILVEPEEPATVLFKHNGLGWHQVGSRMHGFFANTGFRVTFPLPGSIFADRSQAIIIPAANAVTGATSFGYWQFNMPKVTHQPTVGLDTFGTSGARFYTGWIDGGFFDIDGTLLRMNIDAFFHNTGESVIVEYRLDNDPVAEQDATWTRMVNAAGTPSAFSSTVDALYFDNDDAPKAGIAYRTVQFRITLIRGADATSSPELRALTLVHLKTPEIRTQWSFQIDVNRMIEASKGDNDDLPYLVDGDAATLQNVYAKLRELWTNNHTLLPFTCPSMLEDEETLYVKMVEMPISFDDFRTAVAGLGVANVSVLEPVT